MRVVRHLRVKYSPWCCSLSVVIVLEVLSDGCVVAKCCRLGVECASVLVCVYQCVEVS